MHVALFCDLKHNTGLLSLAKTETKMKADKKTTIRGTIEAIRYRSSDGFCIFSVLDSPGSEEVFGSRPTVNCKGFLPATTEIGDIVTITGTIEQHLKYGAQLKVDSAVPEPPDTDSEEGVTRLLMKLPGIGRIKAEKAIKELGYSKAWECALSDPGKIGVKPSDCDRAKEIAISLSVNYEIVVALLGFGMTDHEINKVIACYGQDAVKIVTSEPYQMISDIDGFGFSRVDGIALKAGIAPRNHSRVMAAILYILESSENEGNIFFPASVLCAKAQDFLETSAMKHQVPLVNLPGYGEVKNGILGLRDEGLVVIDKQKIFSSYLLNAEKSILGALG